MQMAMHAGAMGASARRDGYGATSYPANIANVPVEILESRVPILVLGRHLLTDSGGPGKYRGGCGIRVIMRWEGQQPGEAGFSQTQEEFPPRGRLGGHPGRLAEGFINGSPLPAGKVTLGLKAGDVLIGEGSGGGGFYPPQEREPEKVLRDVIDGYVSVARAREAYKVAIDEESMAIDWDQTLALREGPKARAGWVSGEGKP